MREYSIEYSRQSRLETHIKKKLKRKVKQIPARWIKKWIGHLNLYNEAQRQKKNSYSQLVLLEVSEVRNLCYFFFLNLKLLYYDNNNIISLNFLHPLSSWNEKTATLLI